MSLDRWPTFFLVGAPRCGTTAMFHYLGAHPDVFEPPVKEPYYFGRDLLPPHVLAQEDRLARYRALFDGWTTEAAAGDGTPWGLFSETAAAEIAAYAPHARIIAMVRDPVQMLHSLYHLYHVTQTPLPAGVVEAEGGVALSFEEALATADARRERVRASVAEGTYPRDVLAVFHPDLARYTAQIQRYLDVFGPEQVHVVTYDRFKADTAEAYRGVVEFLGLDRTFTPAFEVQNSNRRVRSQALHRGLRRGTMLGPLGRAVKAVIPEPTRRRVVERLIQMNLSREPRPVVAPETAARLRADFRDEVSALGELLGEDLVTRWGYRDA